MKMLAAAILFAALAGGGALAAPSKEAMPDFAAMLPKADLAEGRQESYKCQQCHDMTNTKLNQFGPPLWNVINRPRATAPGFQYSPAMKMNHLPWTYDRLFTYLKSPQLYVPGTPMSFSGIRNVKNRINVIAYLRTMADTPPPLPAPAAAQ